MIKLIACVGKDGGLGYKGDLLFHFPEDMTFFKDRTMGHVVVMGRKTYESIGRPLKGRANVVLTSDRTYKAEGCNVINSLEDFWRYFYPSVPAGQDVYIIGGGELYRQFIEHAGEIFLTEVNESRPADTFFPNFDKSLFRQQIKATGKEYRIMRYTRNSTL